MIESRVDNQILIARDDGLFSNVYSVLGALDWCAEHGKKLAVRFDSGPYLDPTYGPNWWEYFFERLTEVNPMDLSLGPRPELLAFSAEMATRVIRNRPVAADLIRKHLVIKPHVTRGLDEFWAKSIGERFAIGLHLRGTDKFQEYPRPSLTSVFQTVERLTRGRAPSSWRVFLATDDAAYLAEASAHFGEHLVFQRVIRSEGGHALHRPVDRDDWSRGPHGNRPYPAMVTQPSHQIGLEAIRDALLLSRSDVLLAAESNLSYFAAAYCPTVLAIQTDDVSLTQFIMMRTFYIGRIAQLTARVQALESSRGPVRRTLARLGRSIRKRIGTPTA